MQQFPTSIYLPLVSISRIAVYTCQVYSPNSSTIPIMPFVHKSVLCISIPALQICSSVPLGPSSFKAKKAVVLVEVSAAVSNRLTSISQFPFFYKRNHTHTHTHTHTTLSLDRVRNSMIAVLSFITIHIHLSVNFPIIIVIHCKWGPIGTKTITHLNDEKCS